MHGIATIHKLTTVTIPATSTPLEINSSKVCISFSPAAAIILLVSSYTVTSQKASMTTLIERSFNHNTLIKLLKA